MAGPTVDQDLPFPAQAAAAAQAESRKQTGQNVIETATAFLGGNDAFRHGTLLTEKNGAARRDLSTLAARLASEKPSPGRGPRRFMRFRPRVPVTLLPRRVPGLSVL